MSEPTTTAVPKPEDKSTEVTPAVEPTPEPVAEVSAPVPVVPKDDAKDGEPTKTEDPPVTNHVAEPSSGSVPEPKEGDKPAEGSPKEDRPKSPSFLIRFLEGLKIKKRDKTPAPAAEEPTVPAEEPSPADAKPEDKPAVVEPTEGGVPPAEPVEDTASPNPEDPVPQTTQEEQKNGEGKKEDTKLSKSPAKVARRLSARVNEFLTSARRKPVDTPAKVDEAPPKIEEPTPVPPLENPASDSTPDKGEEPRKEETEEANEPPKIIDSTPAPVVATA